MIAPQPMFSLRVRKTYLKVRMRGVWSVVERADDYEAARAAALEYSREHGGVMVAVFLGNVMKATLKW